MSVSPNASMTDYTGDEYKAAVLDPIAQFTGPVAVGLPISSRFEKLAGLVVGAWLQATKMTSMHFRDT